MNDTYNGKLSGNAKALRRNVTKQGCHLRYDLMKGLPVMVRRQKVIGQYVVDFYIAKKKLVIEIDGSQHYEDQGRRADVVRDGYMASLGITVLRYSNADIDRNFRCVSRYLG